MNIARLHTVRGLIGAWLLAGTMLVLAPASLWADDVDDAVDALDRQEYAKAWKLIEPLTRKGDGRALYIAALMAQKGQGMEADLAKAVIYYRLSAAKGFHPAMNNLGVAFREGRGVNKDFAEAMKWFKQAAMLGNSQAALNTGALYANGQGVKPDLVEGYAWYQLSSDELAKKNAAQLEGIDAPPQIAAGMIDSKTGQAQAAFITKLKNKAIEGMITVVPPREKEAGTIGVVYDDGDKFAKSRARLMAKLEQEMPALAGGMPVELKDMRLPDNSGSIKLPADWKITTANQGTVEAHGPNGESVALGVALPIAVPSGNGNGPFVIPYCTPEQAIVAIMPSLNAVAPQTGGPVRENVRVVESQRTEYAGGQASFMVWKDDRIAAGRRAGETSFGLVITAPLGPGAWMLYASAVAAPDERFAAAFPAMLQSWQSWKIDDKVFVERLKKTAETMRETTKVLQSVHENEQKAFNKANAAWDEYLSGMASVIDQRSGRAVLMPLTGNVPLGPNGQPVSTGPNGKPPEPQDLQKWIEEQNRQAGFNRYQQLKPGEQQPPG